VTPLASGLRSRLAKTIEAARRDAESGARQVLQSLAVDRRDAYGTMSLAERTLRRRLRARGREAGDTLDRQTGRQEIDRLVHEVAYEHWHRMLFARYLAENDLLIHPSFDVPLTLDECRELAEEEGTDPWELAGQYARTMLPKIFGTDDPVFEVVLPPEARQELEALLESLPPSVFTASDSLGWTYQFWQAKKKDQVYRSGVKIGADELPVITQLFTEHYMVRFLFHNTVGAWHAGKILAKHPDLAARAAGEDELREAVRVKAGSGYDFSYLRFVRTKRKGDAKGERSGPWRPAAGAFERWPRTARELKVFDPCCGSGHFLVEGLTLLTALRMEEEALGVEEAVSAVLRDNLFGLEIDRRCTQIAAFNVALRAWRMAGAARELPPLNVACSGLAPNR